MTPTHDTERHLPARNVAQRGDALALLQSLPANCPPLVFFDPQHRAIMDMKRYGNEGERQRERCKLPAMSEDYIDACCIESARVLKPSGYLMLWMDKFCLVEAHHQRIPRKVLERVDLIAWDNLRLGQGDRARNRGDYLLVLQKPPKKARATWRDRGIPCRWVEKIDLAVYPRKLYPHAKPVGLIERLIAAVTLPGDLVIDPAAGSFVVMHAALRLGREFIGCDADAAAVERAGFAALNFPPPGRRQRWGAR
jgi:site-specific DNA-methyltransferase (adenine-specific)